MIPIIGYGDKLTVAPGDTIAFKVSSTGAKPYRARLVRLISGDPNPESPGIQEAEIPADFEGAYASRFQTVSLGSYIRVPVGAALDGVASFTASATIWPTTPDKPAQGVIARMTPEGAGFALAIGPSGAEARLNGARIAVGKPLRERRWARVWCAYDAEAGTLAVGQEQLQPEVGIDDGRVATTTVTADGPPSGKGDLLIASLDGTGPATCFNGKLERPVLYRGAVPHGLHGRLVNLPARAMTGAAWSGEEMCWRHRPSEYGAIHFHDDDIDDCRWTTDFSFTLPDGMKSGVYGARLTLDPADGGAEDVIPFFVRPKQGERQADFCVVIPTFTYVIYANQARLNTTAGYLAKAEAWGARPWTPDTYPGFGLSTYNFHSDGSGERLVEFDALLR